MPELPEVETIVRGLEKRVAGDSVESVWIGSRKQPLKSPASAIARALEGKRIGRVRRAGKHIVFELVESNKRGRPSEQPVEPGRPRNRRPGVVRRVKPSNGSCIWE
jgi:hypothetical protein